MFRNWATACIGLILGACSASAVDSNIYIPPQVNVTYRAELNESGTPVWTPDRTDVPAGAIVHATIQNALIDTHHFKVAGVTEEIVVNSNQTITTEFQVPSSNPKLSVYCSLHDPNQTGTQQDVVPPGN